MKICVVGTGYVGLVAGACFAENGNDVICVDIDAEKIEMLKRGEVPIYEPGLEELIRRNLRDGRLQFTTDLAHGVKKSLIIFIAVGTPPKDDGAADLGAVWDVARGIGRAMDGYRIVVNKSTVPVGTAEKVRKIVAAETTHEFDVVSNPEFLKEGAAIEDFMKPDRIIIGTDNGKVAEIMRELYDPFNRLIRRVIVMDIHSAELTKYAANAMLALRVSFMNEIANICERVGANADNVRIGIGSDTRIGHRFLFPGVGYGGSCFPKDVKALISTAEEHGYEFKILKSADEVNEQQKRVLFEKIYTYFRRENASTDFSNYRIGLWGLAFKPRTDDMREAPSIVIINELLEKGFHIVAYDPEAMKEARKTFGARIEYAQSDYECVRDADALAIITDWNEFRRPDFDKIRRLMKRPLIFDGRNLFEPERMKSLGFEYFSIGR
jgi:UDPglucose 6-dehydrogenase